MPLINVPNQGVVNFPDSMSDADITAAIKKNALNYTPKNDSTLGNIALGAIKGASDIGTTLLRPVDAALNATGLSDKTNVERKAQLGQFFNENADPNSLAFKGGALGAQIAGTAGVGGALAKGAMAVPQLAQFAPLLQSGGFSLGEANTGNALLNTGLRVGSGAINGGIGAGLINPASAGVGAAIGGAIPGAGAVIGGTGKAIGNAISGDVSPEVAALADKAKNLGVDIPLDRLTNSKPLNAIASSLNYVPFSGRAATEKGMEDGLMKAVSNTFGQDTPNITMALRNAKTDLGGQFDKFLTSNPVKVDSQLTSDISQTLTNAEKELSPTNFKIIQNQAQDLLDKVDNGVIDGQAGYNVKKALDRISKNPELSHYAGQLRNNYFDGLTRSVGQDAAQGFTNLRQQYGNMMQIGKLAQNGADAGISVARLGNMRNINSPQLHDVADIAAQFVKSREGQHGAAQRVAMGIFPTAGFLGGGLTGALASVPLAAGVGRGINGLLNSQTLKNAALGQAPELPQLLQQYGLLGIPSTASAQ